MSFISYYFHWGFHDVMELDHHQRRRFCEEISTINRNLNPSSKDKEKSIFELKESR